MEPFAPKTFNIPALKGISAKNIEEHLKLYQGYVKNANLINEKLKQYSQDMEGNSYVMNELLRRFSFEYNGMRNHEVYFSSFEGGPKPLSSDSELMKKMLKMAPSFDAWIAGFKAFASTVRGIGWATIWYDPKTDNIDVSWIDEQHLGQLQGCTMILGLDLWEHSYVADYQPSGKKNYIEDFFANVNWSVIEKNFEEARK